ncbi:hypothetical protein HK098_005054 [Nowakowskiella sp. JEL0407]|nr:hypothetical protein HK098_005054 [Nowakowskiella sp. JEL0407]
MDSSATSLLAKKQRLSDPVYKYNAEITSYMNINQPDAVLLYAKHFGKAPDARKARMIEIDTKSFIVQYYDKKDDDDLKTVTIEFSPPLKKREDTRDALTNLAVEAAKALKIKYNPGPLKTTKDIEHWESPGIIKTVAVLSLWISFLLYTILPASKMPPPFNVWRTDPDVTKALNGAWTALAFIHTVQPILVFLMCKVFGGLPLKPSLYHAALSLVFGAAHLQTPITIATKEREKRFWREGKGSYQPSKEEIDQLAKQDEEEDKKADEKEKKKKPKKI